MNINVQLKNLQVWQVELQYINLMSTFNFEKLDKYKKLDSIQFTYLILSISPVTPVRISPFIGKYWRL